MFRKILNSAKALVLAGFVSWMPLEGHETIKTHTPIEHLVIIIPENASFDHLFGAYPKALNSPGEPYFKAKPNTRSSMAFPSLFSTITQIR